MEWIAANDSIELGSGSPEPPPRSVKEMNNYNSLRSLPGPKFRRFALKRASVVKDVSLKPCCRKPNRFLI
jgi:hypothetical protein